MESKNGSFRRDSFRHGFAVPTFGVIFACFRHRQQRIQRPSRREVYIAKYGTVMLKPNISGNNYLKHRLDMSHYRRLVQRRNAYSASVCFLAKQTSLFEGGVSEADGRSFPFS